MPPAPSALATSRRHGRWQSGVQHSMRHADADVESVSVLSFVVHAKVNGDLKYVIRHSYG